ncbi:MAG: bifunctional anthranilate synthase component II/anthranilate phosphoribosyltransferase [Spirochaetales bacterium]|nr:bifunctional anthranilate synthase component II/anthranilate phosphoribosyltransferase [Spirochaetales bacterium]
MIILLDNYDSFTYNIYQYLSELTDTEIRVFRNDTVSVEEIEALAPESIVISPGPGRPEESGVSVDVIKRMAGKTPILGICLGCQAIGYAFGGTIVQAERIVHGKTDTIGLDGRGLFRTIPSPSTFTRYHSLVIDSHTVPAELEVTAWSSDGEIMGVRHIKHTIEGVQFHPESVASDYGREVLRNFLNYRREPLAHKQLLNKVIHRQDMTRDEAAGFMRELTEGALNQSQIAAYLIALNSKGIVSDEIAGCASVLREKRTPLRVNGDVLDTCGTGGDGLGTFNISSMSALAASACGAVVAKHGNRAVSSLSGSADFYRELEMVIDLPPARTEKLIEKTGFAFLFAPLYHGAMKYAAPVRRDLGIKTIMNLLGPLVNPAGASFQLIGVYDDDLCLPMAEAAAMLGIKRAMIVHGADGIDEVSVTGPTRVVSVDESGVLRDRTIEPSVFGIEPFGPDDLKGGAPADNAQIAMALLNGGGPAAIRESVAVNTAAALVVAGIADDLRSGYEAAKEALASGAVRRKLKEVVETSRELAKDRFA